MRGVQAGDQAAISRALELHLPMLRSLISERFHLSREEGEDVLQEVRMAFLQSAARFRGDCSLQTYLVRITCHKCVDYLRMRNRDRATPNPGLAGTGDVDDSVTVSAMIDRVAIQQAVCRLAPRERQVMDLFYGEGRSYREIAARMGIAVGTVGAMKAEALAKLREALCATKRTQSENRDE